VSAVPGLEELVGVLSEWAAGKAATVYLFGSRVRGDHRPDSDVDVVIEWGTPDQATMDWWQHEQETDFADLKSKLPGPLKILEPTDPMKWKVVFGKQVGRKGNVVSIDLPPK
jgi:predicted nucleotidyltransferase